MADKKYFVDEKQFLDITSPEVAYILGLLWADGYLTKPTKKHKAYCINIEAIKSDMIEVLPLFEDLGRWSVYERSRNDISRNTKTSLCISISSKKLWEVLKRYDYDIKSSASADKILAAIPDYLKHYWLRGYFDGDGTISFADGKYPTMNFTGSYSQDFTFLFGLLKNLGIPYHHYQKQSTNSGYSRVQITSIANNKKFYDYIYKDKQFGLNRKKIKFDEGFKSGTKSKARYMEYNGEIKNLTEIALLSGINRSTLYSRLRRNGENLNKALGL